MPKSSDDERAKLANALERYRNAVQQYGWQATLTPKQLSYLGFLERASEILGVITGVTLIGGVLFLLFNYGIGNFLWICLKLVIYSPVIILAMPLHILGFLVSLL